MDRDQVLAYMARLNNEWEATDNAISEAFTRDIGKPQTLPFHVYDWRQDYYAWGKWYADVKDDWWIGADEYNAAVEWDRKLKQWQSKIPEVMAETPAAPIPDKAPTVADDINRAGGGILSGIGPWLAGGVALAAYFKYKGKS